MRPSVIIALGLTWIASPSHGQGLPPTQIVDRFVISSLPNAQPEPFCAATGPNDTPFSVRIVVTGGGNNVLNLINTTWKLTDSSKGSVTLRVNQKTLTKEFAPASGNSADTTLRTFFRKESDISDQSFLFSMFIPGSKTEIVFPAGQTFQFDAPSNNAYMAFKKCLDQLWAPAPSSDPFAKR